MSKKHVYSKSEHGIGDFVYVDLLPEVRRPRQFNVNVILSLFFAVITLYLLVFIPVTSKTAQLEDLNSWNNDLQHNFELINEEFRGYEIDLDVVNFETNISELETMQVDFNNLLDDIELQVNSLSGDITYVSYSAENSTLRVTVEMSVYSAYPSLDQLFLNLDWVTDSGEYTRVKNGDDTEYTATYTLEVDPSVE